MITPVAVRPLLVAETFGPTVQGEGPSQGRQAIFVRLSRCNLSCPSCDTPYTWNWNQYDVQAETTRLAGDDIVAWALAAPSELVVITGGEPLLQQALLEPVVTGLTGAGRWVEIETNGTLMPSRALAQATSAFNVSPKLVRFAAPKDADTRICAAALNAFQGTGKARYKFVVSSRAELAEIAELQNRFGLDPIWVMPEGTAPEPMLAVMREIADDVVARGWNITTRLHVLLWGDQRGR